MKYYFINNLETNNIDKQDKQTVIIYRNYSLKKLNEKIILKIKKYCRKRGIKFYLSNNIKLAIKFNLDGAYIPSFNKNTKHLAYSFKKNFEIIGSAHNLKEIRAKENQKNVLFHKPFVDLSWFVLRKLIVFPQGFGIRSFCPSLI